MKAVVRVGKWRPMVGVFCLGVAAIGLTLRLEGAVPKWTPMSQVSTDTTAAPVRVSNAALYARGAKAEGQYVIHPPQVVDWADDEPTRLRRAGLLKGAMPLPTASVTAGTGCTFDVECEDGLPCTEDNCVLDINQGPGSGVCTYTLTQAGTPGDCDDGVFCNGAEHCDGVNGATCVNPPDATCCNTAPNQQYCDETEGICPSNSDFPKRRCATDLECGTGFACEHCRKVCTSAADCDDGYACNGAEICSGGQCQASPPMCGVSADCSERSCSSTPRTPCFTQDDCASGTCEDVPLCLLGRCCTGVAPAQPACSSRRLSTGSGTCVSQSDSPRWYPGDSGSETGAENTCGGTSQFNPGVQLGCPKYSSGIEQLTQASPPAHPVLVGPMSSSPLFVAPPNGPGGVCSDDTSACTQDSDCGGSNTCDSLYRLGDDYTIPDGSYINLRYVRMYGYAAVPDAFFVEFWDGDGNFIEDALWRPSETPGVTSLILTQPIAIPPTGRISIVNKREFGPESKFIWGSGTVTAGTNSATTLVINNNLNFNPTSTNPDMPGVLSFELLGEKITPPLGGCCLTNGTCQNDLGWKCDQLGGSFQGVGNFCNFCEGGGNVGGSCGTCATGGATCNSNVDCGANGPCQATDSVCTNNGHCSNNPTGPTCTGVCAAIAGRCSLTGATCTGTGACSGGGGTCGAAGVCRFGSCSNEEDTLCDHTTPAAGCPGLLNKCSNDDRFCLTSSDCLGGGICGGVGTCTSGDCQALAVCASGACCHPDGSCTIEAPAACDTPAEGQYLGAGSSCSPLTAQQNGYLTGSCCPVPGDTTADTGFPDPNGRYDENCADGRCYTGADNCAEAIPHLIPSLSPTGASAGLACEDCTTDSCRSCVVTITGDRSQAGGATPDDSCWGTADDNNDDLGWWEAFTVAGDCTRIRFDYCCTNPTQFGDWAFIFTDCVTCETRPDQPDPYNPLNQSAFRGAPICDEDNLWSFQGVFEEAGTFYIAVNSTLEDELGLYQLHIVAEACPTAACCLPNGTCDDTGNQIDCDLAGGTFLHLPQKFPPTTNCSAGTCDLGSCCTGPGECVDYTQGLGTINQADCTGLGGTYKGGIKCEGGTCTLDTNYSCNDGNDCDPEFNPGAPGGTCNAGPGGAQALAQPNPCPICEFETAAQCQSWDDPGFVIKISDLNQGSGIIAADDFIPAPGNDSITQLCVWGNYFTTILGNQVFDCGGDAATVDDFRVRVYPNTAQDLPDFANPVGESQATSQRAIIPGALTESVGGDPQNAIRTYGYTLVLDTPITGLVANTRYWLEVANDLPNTSNCLWMWAVTSENSTQGNDFSANGSNSVGYPLGAHQDRDLTWCMDKAVVTPPLESRPCCACDGGCSPATLAVCNDAVSDFQPQGTDNVGDPLDCGTEFTCPGSGIPSNDSCETPIELTPGLWVHSTHCSTTDGHPTSEVADTDPPNANTQITYDVWYTFTPVQNCTLELDACSTGSSDTAFDSMGAIYSNGTANCPCPSQANMDQAAAQALELINIDTGKPYVYDESCNAGIGLAGPWKMSVPVTAGICYLIRVGAWEANGRGIGVMDLSCGAPICGDGTRQASNGEQCDGNDLSGCSAGQGCIAAGQPNQCTCEQQVCGNNNQQGSEECDGTDDDDCPGLCVNCLCQNICGNGTKEGSEECDGAADNSCGGTAGRCIMSGPPEDQCKCPPVVCGNNFVDPGEECDGSATGGPCTGAACRGPDDPAGECTCKCPLALQALTADPAPGTKVRFISFGVPTANTGDTALRVRLDQMLRQGFCCNPANLNSCVSTFCDEDADCTLAPNTKCKFGTGPPPNFNAACNPATSACEPNAACVPGANPGLCGINLASFEGQFRYVNSINGTHTCQDGIAIPTFYRCATLGCQPEYRNWAGELAGQVLNVTGSVIAPKSRFAVSQILAACGAAPGANTCTQGTTDLLISTSRWGDVGASPSGAGQPPNPPDGLANVTDVGITLSKVLEFPPFLSEPKMWLKERNPDPAGFAITVTDLGWAIDASLGRRYPTSQQPVSCP